MLIETTPLSGLHVITPQLRTDERGAFGRTWDPAVAKQHGLIEHFDYTCISTNNALHTLRGMHYQKDPHGEVKLVRCTKGAIFDVAIDLRPNSPTFRQWFGAELTADNHTALYIPQGFAHGFLTLQPDSEVLYYLKHPYTAQAATGVRFDDPAFGIQWPAAPAMIAERDAAYPNFAS
jgi:dTDP-4-dehydrorhamnose 3,5-epimerase